MTASASSRPGIATAGGAPQTAMNFGTITIRENGREVQKRVMVTLLDRNGDEVAPPDRYATTRDFQAQANHINGLITRLIGEHTESDARRDFYQNRIITGLDHLGVNSSEGEDNQNTAYTDEETPYWTEISGRILGIFDRRFGEDLMDEGGRPSALLGGGGGGGMASAGRSSLGISNSEADDDLLADAFDRRRSSPVIRRGMSVDDDEEASNKNPTRRSRIVPRPSLSDDEGDGLPQSQPTKRRKDHDARTPQNLPRTIRVSTLPEGNHLSAERGVMPPKAHDEASLKTRKFQSRGFPPLAAGHSSPEPVVGKEEDIDENREEALLSFQNTKKTRMVWSKGNAPISAFITFETVADPVEGKKAQQTAISAENRALLDAAIAEAVNADKETHDNTRTNQLTALSASLDKVLLEDVETLFGQHGIPVPRLIHVI